MDSLPIRWQESLPGSGNAVTSVLVNQDGVYVGSNGYIYLLDPSTGTITASNGLSGYGNHEVRLATPPSTSLLLIGISGWVLGLDPDSLRTRWAKGLPNCGHEVVSLIATSDTVFAGSNGYVYRLDLASGTLQATNPLPGYGNHETRVAISSSLATLFVGINGHAIGLDPSDLNILWNNDLSGSGNGITSVIAHNNAAYVGYHGRVYRLDEAKGDLLNRNDLSGRGDGEVRFAVDETGAYLYVGTNGYGACLQSDDLDITYSVSLPGSGFSITDVVDGNEVAYFANNGFVFEIDLKGKVVKSSSLPGLGRHEVRLGVNADTLLAVGINGHCVGLGL
ncbi:Quino protein alcohol dehydrogenase-like protein [Glonium stellatum]|uniref:Quino protein alcohol dehydrogenase-like protein n=1 Tax=Glonium stellatum TaxID=574774 RepID=A0A8E2JPK1_9PEZI|nr:Quino protein alcohol dehydrogenase-like protein [Glonium stellatum]